MAELLIVWHSRTGGSEAMARAACQGAAAEDCAVRMVAAGDAQVEDMLRADGYLFVCPENLAAMSGMMKEFFDRTYYPVLGRIEGRGYAVMVCAGSDGESAVRQIARIAKGWRLREVAEPMIVNTDAQTPEAILAPKVIGEEELATCREMGQALAAGLAMGVF
ncbi:flavodoxin family protein [Stakelama pacifica]|uniref:NADPH-dependent FMN reductase n=1 Tax=Stakelama pacifica TaxID=517720 RepID=A0A4R6FV50_9SPHN|nr:NAD(P)H-dependent oxidoreductase [Stakelama pacifica]TDN85597.1 NADPH-dependent FMN reductase [Stakelama pacifica]GGO92181.1 flavodoxin [Stakelama pacifica]